MNHAVIFTAGKTHMLYINVPREEAERRFAEVRDNRLPIEVELEKDLKVQVDEFDFKDEILLWGGVVEGINAMLAKYLSGDIRF